MNKSKVLVWGITGLAMSVCGLIMTFIWYMGEERAIRVAATEQVNLEIIFMDSEEEYGNEELTGLLPGETIERKPAVIVDGDSPDVYIRVAVNIGGSLDAGAAKSLKEEIHFCDDWAEGTDSFYYYKKKVHSGSIVPIYERITIPENWDNENAEKAFTIELSAEAIRADQLEPWLLQEGTEGISGWE